MHLAVQQGVDKINSFQADMLLSEEIDIELNKAQIKFINTKYGRNNLHRKGFEESQKRIDDLRTLIREDSNPTIYKGQYSQKFFIDSYQLPNDYMYLVNQRSTVIIDKCEPLEFTLTQNKPVTYFTFGLDFLQAAASFSSDTLVGLVGITADITDWPASSASGYAPIWANLPQNNGFTYPDSLEVIKDEILNNNGIVSQTGMQIYWEEFGSIVAPGEFIVVVDTDIHTWVNWDSSVTNTASGLSQPTALVSTNPDFSINKTVYAQYADSAMGAKRDVTSSNIERINSPNKFIQHDDIFTMLDDPFNTTKYTNPLTTISGNSIDIYTSDIFIIDNVKITYIRKPAEISLNLGTDCELPEHSHQEIVDMTVSSILEAISDPRYKSQQIELSKNE